MFEHNYFGITLLHYSVTFESRSLTTVSWPTENFYWKAGDSEASEGFYRPSICLLMNTKNKEGNAFNQIFRMYVYLHVCKKLKGLISMFFVKVLFVCLFYIHTHTNTVFRTLASLCKVPLISLSVFLVLRNCWQCQWLYYHSDNLTGKWGASEGEIPLHTAPGISKLTGVDRLT